VAALTPPGPFSARANAVFVQFERQGCFCRDRDFEPGKLVFKRTVGLRDTWANVSAADGKK
jgi:hypothetical protein